MNNKMIARLGTLAAVILAPAFFHGGLSAAPPQANAVPFIALNPTLPHTSWSGNPVTLKGTLTSAAWGVDSFTYDWDPGDGGLHCFGAVTDQYDIECPHTYTGVVNTLYTAVLVITDTTTSQISPAVNCPPAITQGACYYTSLNAPPPNLPVEVNNAIDNGLWLVHKRMIRTTSGLGSPIGHWYHADYQHTDVYASGDTGPSALYCTAFEVSGFLTTNIPTNPYAADVALCLNGIFDQLTSRGVGPVTPAGFPTYTPDHNGNGFGVEHNGGSANYQTGMMLDSIAAAGTPTTPVPLTTTLGNQVIGYVTGSGPAGAYAYKDAIFDMVDDYSYCMNQGSVGDSTFGWGAGPAGGWHYTCQQQTGDNSVSQWAAIGIIPARRTFFVPGNPATDPLNSEVLAENETWLTDSFTSAGVNNGYFGYTNGSPIWGPYADTPSGLVQLAMAGKGRGTTVGGHNMWDSAETFVRDNFGNPQSYGAGSSLKDYYYGMFSFTKAMLLHDNAPPVAGVTPAGLTPTPLTHLQSSDDPGTCAAPGVPVTAPGSGSGPCYPPLDWYAAQTTAFGGADPTDGVARTIIGNQFADGSWFGQNYSGQQDYFQTAVAIIMLNKTVFQPVPVACFTSNPTHVASGGPVTLDGGCSVEQNPANHLVSWMWDVSGTGGTVFTIGPGSPQCLTPSCSKMIANFTLPVGQSLPYNYKVRLRVTDSGGLTSDVVGNVVISSPPNPPNANAGGPYNFCPNTTAGGVVIYKPFLLDGTHSTNPDQGTTDGTPGAPPSTIISYKWDYACAGTFLSASGAQVDATLAFDQPAFLGTTFNVCLQVTNNDNLAFPTAGLAAGLSSVASAQVSIHNATDEVCTHCVQDLTGLAKAPVPGVPASIQLYWTDTNTSSQFTIDHYNVYRSTDNFATFKQIAGASSSPFIPAVHVSNPAGGKLNFVDLSVVGGTTYYYRIFPATANDTETCQGLVAYKIAIAKGR
jgi:hypothetical protein